LYNVKSSLFFGGYQQLAISYELSAISFAALWTDRGFLTSPIFTSSLPR